MQGIARIVSERERTIASTILLVILLVQSYAAKVKAAPETPIPSIEFVAKDGRSFKLPYYDIDRSIAQSILAEYEAQSWRYNDLWEWGFLDSATISLSYKCIGERCGYSMNFFIVCNGWYAIYFDESIGIESRKYVYVDHRNSGYECCMRGYRKTIQIHDALFRQWFSL